MLPNKFQTYPIAYNYGRKVNHKTMVSNYKCGRLYAIEVQTLVDDSSIFTKVLRNVQAYQ